MEPILLRHTDSHFIGFMKNYISDSYWYNRSYRIGFNFIWGGYLISAVLAPTEQFFSCHVLLIGTLALWLPHATVLANLSPKLRTLNYYPFHPQSALRAIRVQDKFDTKLAVPVRTTTKIKINRTCFCTRLRVNQKLHAICLLIIYEPFVSQLRWKLIAGVYFLCLEANSAEMGRKFADMLPHSIAQSKSGSVKTVLSCPNSIERQCLKILISAHY